MTPMAKKTMSVVGAGVLGLGAMVGAGIFALLGQAGAVAGSAVWVSFVIAGIISLLQGYAVAELGARYPSSGGLVTFLMEGFGRGHITGVASWLLYFAGLIVTAMVAVSFGSYGSALFSGSLSPVWGKVLATVVVVAVANQYRGCQIRRPGAVEHRDRPAGGVCDLHRGDPRRGRLGPARPSTYPPAVDIVASVALTFFAYIGFAVISFTAADLRDPQRELPRAMYLGVGLTTAMYVLISLGVFGALTARRSSERRHGARPGSQAIAR